MQSNPSAEVRLLSYLRISGTGCSSPPISVTTSYRYKASGRLPASATNRHLRLAYTTLYSDVSSCFLIANLTGPPRCVCSTLATAMSQKVLLEVKLTSTG